MRLKLSGSLLLLLVLCGSTSYAKTNLEALAHKAISADTHESTAAIFELRAMGPEGFKAMLQAHATEISRQVENPHLASSPEWRRLAEALDEVSQQKDSYISGLYWYTDLNQAKAVAHKTGKPILSLRLLGKLSEEFSCANSRFFRTVLYSNGGVSKFLGEHFVLHWQSVRPAPRVTIDFGDGRILHRTLTGNSIHYILDTDGHPIDALPGLYGPTAFIRSLAEVVGVFKAYHGGTDQQQIQATMLHRQTRLNRLGIEWLSDIQRTGGKKPERLTILTREDGTPEALQIASLAMTKAVTEATILRSLTGAPEALGAVTDAAAWNKIAKLHLADAKLDASSIGLIKRQTESVLKAERSKSADKALKDLVQKLEMNIALDTVRNEYLLHTKLYAWLIFRPSRDVEELNKKVYDELFLTPASDPWLGLFSADTYMALENGGVVR